ncbi:unnamed protein product, partial [Staurois parvus]
YKRPPRTLLVPLPGSTQHRDLDTHRSDTVINTDRDHL